MKKFVEYKSVSDAARAQGMLESEVLKMELTSKLVVSIQKKIKNLGLTHLEAANKTGVGRTVITAVMNGNVLSISIDRLITIATGLDLKVTMKVA